MKTDRPKHEAKSAQRDEDVLAQQANEARNRLFEVVDELDRRRHRVEKPLKPALVLIGVAAALALGALALKFFARPKSRWRGQPRSLLVKLLGELAMSGSSVAIGTAGQLMRRTLLPAGRTNGAGTAYD